MKPYKILIAAAALTYGATMAMAQQQPLTGPTKAESTQSDQNPAVGDGSSGGLNAGAKEKIAPFGSPGTTGAATGSSVTAKDFAKVGVNKEGKGGDAVTTTGTGEMNQKKQ